MKLEKTATSYALSMEGAQLLIILVADREQETVNEELHQILYGIDGVYDIDYDGGFVTMAIFYSVEEEHDNELTHRKVADTVKGYIDRKGDKS